MFELQSFNIVFWDFDGVIKESVDVKTEAYVQLFKPFGLEVAERVREHHEINGGMSRFDKFPLYLGWAGISPTESSVMAYCAKFSDTVKQAVIESPWVAGVERVLQSKGPHQKYVLVSATPQAELEFILRQLKLTKNFFLIFGAPVKKSDAIAETLKLNHVDPKLCLMIGDALADMTAAEANQVPFLLRRHAGNAAIFTDYSKSSIEDFSNV